MKRLVLFCALLCPCLAYGQAGVRFDGITFSASGKPIPANVAVCNSPGLTTTAAQVIGNTAILTMSSNPVTAGFVANMQIAVSGFTGGDTYFNVGTLQPFSSTVTISAVSSTTITYPLTHANASASSNGSVFQMGNIATPCAPLASIFSDANLSVPITQPGFTSSNIGNFGFYVNPGQYAIQYYGAGIVTYLQPLTLTMVFSNGNNNFTGQILCQDVEATKCVDSANSQGRSGSDIGGWINAAYAALPSTGGEIHVYNLGNSCVSYSTPIVLAAPGKYPTLVFHGATNGTPSGGGCLNFTPTTGAAISLDYVPVSVSNYPTQHGIRYLTLINNNCVTSGGCGGSAFGINQGNTNWGAANATFDQVSIIGFDFGYNNANTNNLPGIHWINPLFQANVIAVTNGGNTGNNFIGGSFLANQSNVQATTAAGGEYNFIGTQFATNTSGPMFDFTRNSTRVYANFIACHFEDSPAASAATPHYISGLAKVHISGGTMETDQTSGTQDWFISLTSGSFLHVDGLSLLSGGKSLTQAFLLASGSYADVSSISIVSPSQIPTILGGSGGVQSFLNGISSSGTASAQTPFTVLSLKKGTGGGNYTTATTTYAVADSTNLCLTVTIPTGWKLGIVASGAIGTATGAVAANVALTDNAACSTANAGLLVETTETTTAAGVLQPFSLVWVITGDGASHNIALQYKTSNGADSATLLNASATQIPTMVFTLMPSN